MVQNVNSLIRKPNYVKFNIIQNIRPKFVKLSGKMVLALMVINVVSFINNDKDFFARDVTADNVKNSNKKEKSKGLSGSDLMILQILQLLIHQYHRHL